MASAYVGSPITSWHLSTGTQLGQARRTTAMAFFDNLVEVAASASVGEAPSQGPPSGRVELDTTDSALRPG